MFGAGGKRSMPRRAMRTGAVRHARSQTVRGTGIKVEARDGVVTLRGVVEQASVIGRAEAIARSVDGFKAVDNKLIASSLFEHD